MLDPSQVGLALAFQAGILQAVSQATLELKALDAASADGNLGMQNRREMLSFPDHFVRPGVMDHLVHASTTGESLDLVGQKPPNRRLPSDVTSKLALPVGDKSRDFEVLHQVEHNSPNVPQVLRVVSPVNSERVVVGAGLIPAATMTGLDTATGRRPPFSVQITSGTRLNNEPLQSAPFSPKPSFLEAATALDDAVAQESVQSSTVQVPPPSANALYKHDEITSATPPPAAGSGSQSLAGGRENNAGALSPALQAAGFPESGSNAPKLQFHAVQPKPSDLGAASTVSGDINVASLGGMAGRSSFGTQPAAPVSLQRPHDTLERPSGKSGPEREGSSSPSARPYPIPSLTWEKHQAEAVVSSPSRKAFVNPETGGRESPEQDVALTGGNIFLDGALVGRWVSSVLAKQAARASIGPTGYDFRRGRLLPGPSVGG